MEEPRSRDGKYDIQITYQMYVTEKGEHLRGRVEANN
jgi:hypothetical protein